VVWAGYGDKYPLKLKGSCGTFIVAEWLVNFHVEQLPEGGYLATCESIPGLVAQGRTVTETLEIARDVAKKLHEARLDRGELEASAPLAQSFELPVVLSA
jgi:predicted RNase H-like HicB family nuclease